MSKSFEEVGLPPGQGFLELRYHVPTQSVVVLTSPLTARHLGKRLSIRKAHEKRYTGVAKLAENLSIESFRFSQKMPLLYFLVFSVKKMENVFSAKQRESGVVGLDWDALQCYDIRARKHEVMARRGELHAGGDFNRAWLSQILSVSDDGQTLYVVSAVERPAGGMGRYVEHDISSLNLSGLLLTPVSRLEATFA